MWSRFRSWAIVVLIASCMHLIVGCSEPHDSSTTNNGTEEEQVSIRLQPDSYYDNPWVYFLGDEYLTDGAEDSAASWPRLVSAERSWYPREFVTKSIGYVVPGDTGARIIDRVNGTRLQDAAMVVFSAGVEDLKRADGADIGPAILETLVRARELAPTAKFVVLSVIAPAPSTKLDNMNVMLQRVSNKVDAVYLNVSGVLWSTPGAFGPEGTFPTNIGQSALAAAIGPLLPDPSGVVGN